MCQVRQRRALELLPVVMYTPLIFQVLHADTVHMNPPSNGYKYIVHGRCRLSSWIEAKALKEENTRSIGQWLFEDIICRWGSLVKIVTNNGALLSQTSFGHISTKSSTIPTVSKPA